MIRGFYEDKSPREVTPERRALEQRLRAATEKNVAEYERHAENEVARIVADGAELVELRAEVAKLRLAVAQHQADEARQAQLCRNALDQVIALAKLGEGARAVDGLSVQLAASVAAHAIAALGVSSAPLPRPRSAAGPRLQLVPAKSEQP